MSITLGGTRVIDIGKVIKIWELNDIPPRPMTVMTVNVKTNFVKKRHPRLVLIIFTPTFGLNGYL
ncbi:hypothetical protein LBSG162_13910 [Lentilactobacillus buchneri subsp. silagei]|nr:hypothetical protein Ltb232_05510 [Lentilactobacillus buchneri subsp. silagei]GED92286.1 hypothetical protein LBSG162_13910 [Lentilactobacillus buchneri subsp. silagei]GED95088.1 hypothetical protein LBSP_16480 [Lentilactobacillus buchneri subsp. silagei]